jgi:hypothetical protein
MTYLELFMVRRGHPRQIILHLVGGIWAVYFLWQHNWMWALACFAVSELIAETLTALNDPVVMAQTTIGKIMLLHAHPVNFIVQAGGGLLFIYSVWVRSVLGIMAAASLLLLGHIAGWSKVSRAL